MTAEQARYGRRATSQPLEKEKVHFFQRILHFVRWVRKNSPSDGRTALYVYGDRICVKRSKQKELYKEFGAASGVPDDRRGAGVRGRRHKIVLENIINLFGTIEERWKQDIAAAKENAVAKKKFIEIRRGFLIALFMIAFLVGFVMLGYHLFFGIKTIYADNTVNYTGDSVIEMSGIEVGDKLFSFRADEAAERITFACPYIRNVEVERTIPNRVSFALESDQEAYCVNVYGEMLVLSAGLRVLGAYDPDRNGALMELCLPELSYSVAGRVISFVNEKHDRFVREILSCIKESGMGDRISFVDLRDPYQVELYCDGLYLIKLGGEKDFLYKLTTADGILTDSSMKEGTPAVLTFGTRGDTSVLYDHTLDLTPPSQNRG